MTVDEQLKIENFCIQQFINLGFSPYEATKLYDEGIDWHELDRLKKLGCGTMLALKITR